MELIASLSAEHYISTADGACYGPGVKKLDCDCLFIPLLVV